MARLKDDYLIIVGKGSTEAEGCNLIRAHQHRNLLLSVFDLYDHVGSLSSIYPFVNLQS